MSGLFSKAKGSFTIPLLILRAFDFTHWQQDIFSSLLVRYQLLIFCFSFIRTLQEVAPLQGKSNVSFRRLELYLLVARIRSRIILSRL